MIGRDETVVSVLQIWLQGNDSLLSNVSNLFHEVPDVLASVDQVLDNRSEQLLRALFVVRKRLTWRLEPLTVLV